MKKIIAALDGLKLSESTIQYAVYIASRLNAHLVGVFLDDTTYISYKTFDVAVLQGASEAQVEKYENEDAKARKTASKMFEAACSEVGLNYTVHHDRGIALPSLLHESVYADLLIIDARETLTHYDEKQPSRFIRDLLDDVQCPVLSVPRKFERIEKLVFLYEGHPSSVYAIKMFSYLFSEYKFLESELVCVKAVNENQHLPDNRLMKEFMKRHFPNTDYNIMKGIPQVDIVKHLKTAGPNALAVLGAYQRGRMSRWLYESLADILIRETNAPLFIAHH